MAQDQSEVEMSAMPTSSGASKCSKSDGSMKRTSPWLSYVVPWTIYVYKV